MTGWDDHLVNAISFGRFTPLRLPPETGVGARDNRHPHGPRPWGGTSLTVPHSKGNTSREPPWLASRVRPSASSVGFAKATVSVNYDETRAIATGSLPVQAISV